HFDTISALGESRPRRPPHIGDDTDTRQPIISTHPPHLEAPITLDRLSIRRALPITRIPAGWVRHGDIFGGHLNLLAFRQR
ncbi:MAG: hypothetical protein ACI8RE_003123, partial [Ilumatobacter sp.]